MSSHRVSGTGCFRGCGVRTGGCLVLGILLLALVLGFDILEAPWAYPLLGRPTLTGHWAGTFTSRTGTRFALYLELDRGPLLGGSSRERGEWIDGRAYWCDDRGRHVENNPLSASVPMFSGYEGSLEPVVIHIEPGKTAPQGLWPVNLRGEWHLDTFTLTPDLVTFTGHSLQSSTSDPDQAQPVTFSLKKAELDAYRSACAQWGGALLP